MERGYKIYDINELNPGDHLCVIYETDEEHKALITPYLRSGLENHEKVFYIVDARTSEVVLNYLRDDGVDVDPYLESGQLAILTVSESYMKGGVFDPDGMIKMLREETEKALKEGYSALRVTGEMSWALRGLPGSERLIEYEAKLNEFFPNNKALAICQYDSRVFEPEILLDILTTHPIAVIGTEIYENFYYIPTEEFLAGKAPETTLKHWKENLQLHKQMEEALKESERKYRSIFENVQDIFYRTDLKGLIVEISPSISRYSGFKREELIGKPVGAVYSNPEDRKKLLQTIAEKGEIVDYEVKLKTKDNTLLYVSTNAHIWLDENNNPIGIEGSLRDITERKKFEELNLRLAAIVDSSDDAIIRKDLNGNIESWNSGAQNMYGYSEEEMLGKPISILIPPEHSDDSGWIIEKIKNGESIKRYESVRKKKNGANIDVSLTISPIRDLNGNIVGASIIARDITQSKRKDELIKSSLKEKEMLLKEIHHRVKNNLMIISSLLDLQSSYIKDKASRNIFMESQNRVRSMALIHERLYQSTDLKRIDFGEYIQSLSTELFNTYAGDFGLIELKINVEDVMLDINTAIPLGLIVNELVTNSLKHAFPEGMKGEINVDFHKQDDHYQFTVNDNGVGFPFDLDFQNTDSLGLQIVNSLTQQIDGKIELNRSHGTEFKITFKELKYQERI